MATLFISDLHLDESRSETIQLALSLINDFASDFDTLYILGDFVEYWVGDDYCQPTLHAVFDALAALNSRGTAVKLMHGNRDFLITPLFASRYNIELITEDTVCIDLYGVPSLLMHGDTLCTDDIDYQRFRAQVRQPVWQTNFLQTPIDDRLNIVANLRADSQKAIAGKRETIMDVNQHSVETLMRTHRVTRLIHGHTHRPDTHPFNLDGKTVTRFVLGEWKESAEILICTPEKTELITWKGAVLLE